LIQRPCRTLQKGCASHQSTVRWASGGFWFSIVMKCGGTSDCIYRFQPISPVFETLLVTYTKGGNF
jgi:hypothetical protein